MTRAKRTIAVAVLLCGCTNSPKPLTPRFYGAKWVDKTIVQDRLDFVLVCKDGRVVGSIEGIGNEWWGYATQETGTPFFNTIEPVQQEFDDKSSAAAWVELNEKKLSTCETGYTGYSK